MSVGTERNDLICRSHVKDRGTGSDKKESDHNGDSRAHGRAKDLSIGTLHSTRGVNRMVLRVHMLPQELVFVAGVVENILDKVHGVNVHDILSQPGDDRDGRHEGIVAQICRLKDIQN